MPRKDSLQNPGSPQPAIARKPPLPNAIVALLAVCSAISVANVYYAQPLLDALGTDFNISRAAVGGVITATQIGCALALLVVVPLGDIVHRKKLIYVQLVLLTLTLGLVAAAQGRTMLLVGMCAVGLLGTAMTQGLISYAAALAAPHDRGRVVGITQSGVVIGLLMARTLSGTLTDFAGWRTVYITSAILSLVVLMVLWRALPPVERQATSLTFAGLLRSPGTLLVTEPVLGIRGVIGLLMFCGFSIFWSALVLPLSAPPLSMSHGQIGAFGLVGALGALAAAGAGRLADRGLGQWATGVALVCLLISWVPLAFTTRSIWALIGGIILLDLGGQAIHVVNQSMILSARPDAHSRLISCYMLFYSAGSGLGAIASTNIYAVRGWAGVCTLGFAVSLAALIFWGATLRWMKRPLLTDRIESPQTVS